MVKTKTYRRKKGKIVFIEEVITTDGNNYYGKDKIPTNEFFPVVRPPKKMTPEEKKNYLTATFD